MIPRCQIKTPGRKHLKPTLVSSSVFLFSDEGSEKGHHAGIKPEEGLSLLLLTQITDVKSQRQGREKRRRQTTERESGDRSRNGRAELTETMQQRFTVVEGSEQMWRCISYPPFSPSLRLILFLLSPVFLYSTLHRP